AAAQRARAARRPRVWRVRRHLGRRAPGAPRRRRADGGAGCAPRFAAARSAAARGSWGHRSPAHWDRRRGLHARATRRGRIELMEIVLLRGAAGLYLAATVAALTGIAVRRDFPSRLFLWLVGAGLALQVVSIAIRTALIGDLPVANFGEGLSLLAVLLVILFLALQLRGPLLALGAVVMPLAFGLTSFASVLKGGAQPLPAMLQSVWLPVHVLLAFLGDAVFAIACSASVLYLIQERRLKTHRGRGVLRHLPSLEKLDQVSHTCLKWGLILLTLGIVTGIVWAHEAWGRGFWVSDPKLLFSLLVWALYMVLLQGRMTAGWRGRWAAQLTIAGFAVIVVSLLSVNLLGL